MDGRKNNGGARPNAGRKPKDGELKELALIDASISDEDWASIITAVRIRAVEGDIGAAKLLFERRFGKVIELQTGEGGIVQVIFAPHDSPPTD